MEDVSEGLASAWKGAVRGMKSGYKMTKTALTASDKAGAEGGTAAKSHSDARREFKSKYAPSSSSPPSPSHGGAGAAAAAAMSSYTHRQQQQLQQISSEESSSDEEPMTDAQVHEKVEAKYFDKSYDAARFELSQLQATYTDTPEAGKAERDDMERKVVALRQRCNVVSTTLKKRVLLHHHAFVRGTEEIRLVNDSLLQTSSDCKKGRNAIRKAKAGVAVHIELLGQQRRRTNLQRAMQLLDAMKRMCWKQSQLVALTQAGKIVEAAELLKKDGAIEMESELARMDSMKPVLTEWRSYRDNPQKLRSAVNFVITECLCTKFMPFRYCNAFESGSGLGEGDAVCEVVALQLRKSAVAIVAKSLREVSYVKDEKASLDDVAEGIHPDHLVLCFGQLSARLMDFLHMYVTVLRIHRTESGSATSPFALLHAKGLARVKEIGPRIGHDLMEKLTLVLSAIRLFSGDVDRVLHLFFSLSTLVEAFGVLGLTPEEQDAVRTRVKAVIARYMRTNFQTPKLREVLSFMSEDAWCVSDVSASSLNVVTPVSPAAYRNAVRKVKGYLNQDGGSGAEGNPRSNSNNSSSNCRDALNGEEDVVVDAQQQQQSPRRGGGGAAENNDNSTSSYKTVPVAENPFYSPEMLLPQDTSSLFQTQRLSEYYAAHQQDKGSLASRVAVPAVLTSSSLAVTNGILEYVARIAVRYPPLAPDILAWCEELVCTYLYTVADNFVSVSRSAFVEDQGDFSPEAQKVLREARDVSSRAVLGGAGSDPAHGGGGGGASPIGTAAGGTSSSSHIHDGVSGTSAPVSGAYGEAAGITSKYPPRVFGRIKTEFTSEAHQYALGHRAVACDTCVTLAFVFEAAVHAVGPLLPASVTAKYVKRSAALHATAVELLHVCLHRLSQAILPLQGVCVDIAKMKPGKDEVKVSAYVGRIIIEMKSLQERCEAMPTPVLETLFFQRLLFSVQCLLIHEYCKHAKKRLSDMAVMQFQVDVQNFQQQAAALLGRANVVLPSHVLSLVKTGFYMDDREQRMEWMKRCHSEYNAADLAQWLSGGDRAFKMQLEDTLGTVLGHYDALPLKHFAVPRAQDVV